MCANTGDVAKAISDLQTLMDAHLGEALRKALWEAGPGGEVRVHKIHDELMFDVKQATIRRTHEQARG